jgi:hypothetical protein
LIFLAKIFLDANCTLKLVIDSNGDVVDGSDANGDTQGEKGVTFARLLAPLRR